MTRPIWKRGDVRAAVATGIDEADPLSMLELSDDWPDEAVFAFEQIHAAFERTQQPDLYGKVVVQMGES